MYIIAKKIVIQVFHVQCIILIVLYVSPLPCGAPHLH